MTLRHIKFESFSGYLNYLGDYAGYGGMQWNSMYEVQNAYLNQQPWCDTGYNNALDGNGEAITLGTGGFQAYNLGRTFTLMYGTFASAWEAKQPITFNTYTYTSGQGFTLKASDVINIGQHGKTIYFSNYGTDFSHISAVTFVSGQGNGGNTCSYGYATYGYTFVMDDLAYHWNRTAAAGEHHPARQHHGLTPQMMPHLNALFAPAHAQPNGDGQHQAVDQHAQGHDPGGAWTTGFNPPNVDHHFGF